MREGDEWRKKGKTEVGNRSKGTGVRMKEERWKEGQDGKEGESTGGHGGKKAFIDRVNLRPQSRNKMNNKMLTWVH